ncbi:hypothetical protein PIB30_067967 [Stylosanthes scabra]|uniref:Uncharacterized protein n=1 Tax=Stylosanthes scabra TaxID=79078 RepID=A0ABU6SNT0_9FABA|nr:hypothetical protein [Stylosanthes scabra]
MRLLNPTKEVGEVHQADSSRWPPYGQRILRQCLGTRQREEEAIHLHFNGADWVRHKDGRPHYFRRADIEPMIKALCVDAKIPAIPDDTLIPQEPPIIGVAMTRTRNPRPARQATPPQQEPPQEQPQP